MNEYSIEYIKRILSNYRYVTNEISICNRKLEEIDVKRGVHAIRYDKEATQGSTDPVTKAINDLDLTEQYHLLEIRKDKAIKELNNIQDILGLFNEELKNVVFKIYCERSATYIELAKELYMDESTLKHRVNKEIERITTRFTIV